MCPYTHEMGLRAVRFAQDAYCDWELLAKNDIGFIQNDDYKLQAVFDQEQIAFRGSQNLENWILDLDALRTPFENAYVHKGFYKAWQALKPQVMNRTYNHSILITGHSLGGAIAQLAAADFAQAGYNVTLVTFGSPRVGDQAFASLLHERVNSVYRVTHSRDPVVHVPYVFMGFIHAGPEIFYKSLVDFEVCNTLTESIYCGANTLMPLPSVKEHLDYLVEGVSTCRLRASEFLK